MPQSVTDFVRVVTVVLALTIAGVVRAESRNGIKSHPPLRPMPQPSTRPVVLEQAFFVAPNGDDANPGTMEKPWRTINSAMVKITPGSTLYLRGGSYYENVYCALPGTEQRPITMSSYPGETAVIDGGLPEFQTDPANAWEPVPDGADGEFRSRRKFPNIRDVVGLFGDSNIGLQTYWHREDLVSTNEVYSGDKKKDGLGIQVIYCGPGIWYDRATGYIHVRLAHTNFTSPLISNYKGETDPRKLPLVIAPFQSVAMHVDLATHIRFQDLVFRGGGMNCVKMSFGMHVEFDHVTIYGGTYGLRSKNSGPVKFMHSAIYGGIPPWGFYGENALHIFKPSYTEPYADTVGEQRSRNTVRMTNHALLVMEGYEESDVFAYPFNNRWEIAFSEFADGHDGIYPNGSSLDVHDNWIGNMQDDALYLSSPTRLVCDNVHVYRNYITGCTSALGFHGRGGPEGSVYMYGNIVDGRYIGSGRFRTESLDKIRPFGTNFFLVHGAATMQSIESLYFYHNTAILPGNGIFLGSTNAQAKPTSTRHSMNNIFVYMDGYPGVRKTSATADTANMLIDGNLHWSPRAEPKPDWLNNAAPFEKRSVVGSPGFVSFNESPDMQNDYRPEAGSVAGTAVSLPESVKLKGGVGGSHIGAFQPDSAPLKVGIDARIVVGSPAR